jgi:hypothetical protein
MTSKRQQIGIELAASPRDVELQRIYADALLEEGGEQAIRGELIQIELNGGNTARRLELAAHVKKWREARGFGGLGDPGRMGLARDWWCTADQFVQLGAAAFAEEPLLEWITIGMRIRDDAQREMKKLAASPTLARLRRLCIFGCEGTRPGAKGLATLLASPFWPKQLVSLRLPNCRIFDAGAELLANATSLANLEWLDLWANGVQPDGIVALARSPIFAKLEHLLLWGNFPGARGLTALAAPENRMKLVQLDLDETEQAPDLIAALVKRFPGIEIRANLPDPDEEDDRLPFDRSPFD